MFIFCLDMKEGMYKFTLLPTQVNFISMNRNIVKKEFNYQVQIRICKFEEQSPEISDNLPPGLIVRVNGQECSLPPITGKTHLGTLTRFSRPIDCTQFIKLNPNLVNHIIVNWIQDEKNYVMAVYVVKQLSADTLFQKLCGKATRSSEDTKNDIIKKLTDVDPDFATTSYSFSLICPLGKIKMKVPAKSIKCNHLQCFDAFTFILMNEKNSTWMCPTCDKPCLYDDIQIQSYFFDIITNHALDDSCNEIEILADGTWRKSKEVNNTVGTSNTQQKLIDFITLDDNDNNDHSDGRIPSDPESSYGPNILLVDLTLSDDVEESLLLKK